VRRAVLLALALGLFMVGCGKKNEPEPPSGPDASYGKVYPRPSPPAATSPF
jgi:hypothetical protein